MSNPTTIVSNDSERPRILIVGAGFAGLCMAIGLKQAGMHDFVILEKAGRVGGTWRENTYPGCGCDVMSLMYSYSFAPNRQWTRMYARQGEILDYIERTADDYGVTGHIRFDTEVTGYDFDDAADEWRVSVAGGGTLRAQVVVAGPGPLHRPHIPDLPGLETFTGSTFHSARWNHDEDLAGKRVAVIGTGASAVQFIPQMAKSAARVEVFQRTPHWVIPKLDRRISGVEHRLFRAVPAVQRAYRNAIYWGHESIIAAFMNPKLMTGLEAVARRHLARQVHDPGLRARLTPDYTIGCKRILVSSDYYPALQRDNVSLVTDAISAVTGQGITTADGATHEVDTIIFGTGFHVTDALNDDHLVGRDGLTIQEAWQDGIEAHLGVSVAGFPNFFFLLGPNSGGGNQSIIFMIEAQVRYILGCLRLLAAEGGRRIEVRASVQREFNRKIHKRLAGSVWNAGGCESWYLDDKGFNRAAWPGSSASYWRRMRAPHRNDFDIAGADEAPETHRGPATLIAGDAEIPVEVHLAGHIEPIDGSYRWKGRITAHPEVTALHKAGTNQIRIRIPGGTESPARLDG
jgi:cation diffusion facilitator CzcD-associated flavoprotein CzcO